MPLLIVFYFLGLGLLALLAQMVLPIMFPLLNMVGFGSALIPLVVISASLQLGDERAPFLAGALGLLLDLTSSHRLGLSMLVLSSLSALIITQAHKPEMRHALVRLTYLLVGTFLFMVVNYALVLIESGRWYWPLDVWSRITFASLLNLTLSPFFFVIMGLPRLCGWKPAYQAQERRYAR